MLGGLAHALRLDTVLRLGFGFESARVVLIRPNQPHPQPVVSTEA